MEPIPSTTLSDEKTPESEAKPGDKPVAPEAYADFTAPEGYTIDKAMLEKAAPIFKELGLTQDQAQKLVTLQAEREIAAAKAPQDAYNALREGWRKEVLKDTSLSDGTRLKPDVSASIGRAIDTLGPELGGQFREVMNLTGAGDNPAFVRAMVKFASAITEGRPAIGKGPSPEGQKAPNTKPPSVAAALYPNLP